MPRELTFWISPFTTCGSLDLLISKAKHYADVASSSEGQWHANLLLPTHYGQYWQGDCHQTIPADALVSSADDIGPIRAAVEGAGVGFGVWGVPVDQNGAAPAAASAEAGGFYMADFERGPDFWRPGDDPDAVNAWWTEFWDTLGEGTELDGNVGSTLVPSDWELGYSNAMLAALAGGSNLVALETYGGPATSGSYPYPSLWPTPSFARVTPREPANTALACILAIDNLSAQIKEAYQLSSRFGVQVWKL